MSTPSSIAEAFGRLEQRQNTARNNAASTDAVDILGIVSNISAAVRTSTTTRQQALSSCQRRVRRCQMWLLDESLDNKRNSSNYDMLGARFVLYGSSDIQRLDKEQIRVGDILRFNRVAVRKTRGSPQFQFSSNDPEPGINWFRLGHIDGHGRLFEKNIGDVAETRIPKSMITSKKRLAELVNWYKNRSGIGSLSTPNTLPTRKRQLEEIQSSAGFLSNINVRVLHVRSESAIAMSKDCSSGKREFQNRTQTQTPTLFATFTDDSGAIMTFIDSSGRFLTELRSAKNYNHAMSLLMTNVSTEYQSNLQGLTTSAEKIVLVPTKSTHVRLVAKEERFVRNNTNNIDSSQPNPTQYRGTRHTTEVTVLSGITDMVADGVSLKNTPSVFSSRFEYLRTVIGKSGTFKRSIIYLDTNDEQACKSGILASPDVLNILCGSLTATELLEDEMICAHSMRFFRALIEEHISFDWTLNKDKDGKLEIVKVALRHLS